MDPMLGSRTRVMVLLGQGRLPLLLFCHMLNVEAASNIWIFSSRILLSLFLFPLTSNRGFTERHLLELFL